MMNLNECRIQELEQENKALKGHVERLRGHIFSWFDVKTQDDSVYWEAESKDILIEIPKEQD